jgi:sarcosine oxidase subunit delta
MKIMHCPLNGPRNISEFVWGGEVRDEPDPTGSSDAKWAEHVFLHDNQPVVVREWWLHAPTAYWFIAERNALTDEILRTYPASEIFASRRDYTKPDAKNDGGGA